MSEEPGRKFAYEPARCPSGSWSLHGYVWQCGLCGVELRLGAIRDDMYDPHIAYRRAAR